MTGVLPPYTACGSPPSLCAAPEMQPVPYWGGDWSGGRVETAPTWGNGSANAVPVPPSGGGGGGGYGGDVGGAATNGLPRHAEAAAPYCANPNGGAEGYGYGYVDNAWRPEQTAWSSPTLPATTLTHGAPANPQPPRPMRRAHLEPLSIATSSPDTNGNSEATPFAKAPPVAMGGASANGGSNAPYLMEDRYTPPVALGLGESAPMYQRYAEYSSPLRSSPMMATPSGVLRPAGAEELTPLVSSTASQSRLPVRAAFHQARPRNRPYAVNLKHMPCPARDLPVFDPTSGRPPYERPLYRTEKYDPPMEITNFIGIDGGSASPKFVRPTTLVFPATAKLAKECSVPLSAVISPLSLSLTPEERVPVITGRKPLRCSGCKGYLSSHAAFRDQGTTWLCPLCDRSNGVPRDFTVAALNSVARDSDGMIDKEELLYGSVEYEVDEFPEYALRNEKGTIVHSRPLRHLFLVDISRQAAATFLPSVVMALRATLQEMAGAYGACEVSFVTYATTVHFYNFSHPQIPQLIVPDVGNPFVPLPFSSLCWLCLDRDLPVIFRFLDQLAVYAADTGEEACAVGAALQAASLVLAGSCGGRITVFAHGAPRTGIGALAVRDVHKLSSTRHEKTLFAPQKGFWTKIATQCAVSHIGVDIILFADVFSELVTLGQVAVETNGKLHLFRCFDPVPHAPRLQAALDEILLEEVGYGAILRVRCSRGVRVLGYRGHYSQQTEEDMDLAVVQGSSTFTVDFAHDATLDPTLFVVFQAAMVYTTRLGQRRVRVHTYRMPISTDPMVVFSRVDLESLVHLFVHEALQDTASSGDTQSACVANVKAALRILHAYRKHTPSAVSAARFTPDMVSFLPFFLVSIFSCAPFMEQSAVLSDQRMQCFFELSGMSTPRLLRYLCPRLYSLHEGTRSYPTNASLTMAGSPAPRGNDWVAPSPADSLTSCVHSSPSYVAANIVSSVECTPKHPMGHRFGHPPPNYDVGGGAELWDSTPSAYDFRSTTAAAAATGMGGIGTTSSSNGMSYQFETFGPSGNPGARSQLCSDSLPSTPNCTVDRQRRGLAVLSSGPNAPATSMAMAKFVGTLPGYGEVDPTTQQCVLPPPEQLTCDTIVREGVYLLVDEQMLTVYLWLGSQVSPAVLQELFATDGSLTHPRQITQEMIDVELYGVDAAARGGGGAEPAVTMSRRLRRVVDALTMLHPPCCPPEGPADSAASELPPPCRHDESSRPLPLPGDAAGAMTSSCYAHGVNHPHRCLRRLRRLLLLHDGDPAEKAFFDLLLEDRYFPMFDGQEELLKVIGRRNAELRHRAGLGTPL